jgi:transcriptional regulator with XRE-family HTH domain
MSTPVAVLADLSAVIGRNVARLRDAAGLSQEAFAERLGASRQMVASVETGTRTPSIQMLARLAAALGTTPALLLTEFAWQPVDHGAEAGVSTA